MSKASEQHEEERVDKNLTFQECGCSSLTLVCVLAMVSRGCLCYKEKEENVSRCPALVIICNGL